MRNKDNEMAYKVNSVKKDYIIQYSIPTKNRIAISDWLEKTKIVKSDNIKNAIKLFNKNRLGTWYILDCYEK